MTKEEFEFLRAFLKSQSGLVLSEDKTYLVESRLRAIALARGPRDLGLESLAALEAIRDEEVIEPVANVSTQRHDLRIARLALTFQTRR